MIKKVIVASESTNLHSSMRFITEAKKLKLSSEHINPYEFKMQIPFKKSNTKGIYLFRTTGIRYDDFDLEVGKYHEALGFKIVNPLFALPTFRAKDSQQFFLHQNQLPIIDTILFRGNFNAEENIQALKKLSKANEFVLKMNRGNGGIGVQLIRGLDSLLSIIETYSAIKDQKFIIQPYIAHKKEYRILASQNKILALIEKTIDPQDFRGNSKRSKARSLKQIDGEMIDLVTTVLKSSKLDYVGIDVIKSDRGLQILEVNAIPGFKQVEELTEINIARELLIDFLVDYNK